MRWWKYIYLVWIVPQIQMGYVLDIQYRIFAEHSFIWKKYRVCEPHHSGILTLWYFLMNFISYLSKKFQTPIFISINIGNGKIKFENFMSNRVQVPLIERFLFRLLKPLGPIFYQILWTLLNDGYYMLSMCIIKDIAVAFPVN